MQGSLVSNFRVASTQVNSAPLQNVFDDSWPHEDEVFSKSFASRELPEVKGASQAGEQVSSNANREESESQEEAHVFHQSCRYANYTMEKIENATGSEVVWNRKSLLQQAEAGLDSDGKGWDAQGRGQ